MSFNNQRHLTIHKKKKDIFVYYSREAMQKATTNLRGNDFMLWVILASNQDSYEFDFSPRAISNEWGMAYDSVKTAFGNLIKKGYIVEKENGKCDFYDTLESVPKKATEFVF